MDTKDALGRYFAYKYERNNRIRATGHKLLGGDACIGGKSLDEIERELAAQGVSRSNYVKTGLRGADNLLIENDALFSKNIVETIDSLDANQYVVPYMWGTSGILYNKQWVDSATVSSWGAFWNPAHKGKVLMKDSYSDAYGTALLYAYRDSLAH